MAKCETCGNDYDRTFTVILDNDRHIFDSFEWWRLRPDRCLLGPEPDDPEFKHYAMSAVAEGAPFLGR